MSNELGETAQSIGTPTIVTDQATYTVGQTITVTWNALPGNVNDWVAIAPAGSSATTVTAWRYTGGATDGSESFAGIPAGSFVARAFVDDSYTVLAESATLTVGGTTGVTVLTDKLAYPHGSPVVVTWAGLPGATHDWIAIAPEGSAPTSVTRWIYTGGAASGSFAFEAPPADGAYVARAFANDTYQLLGQSETFQVGLSVTTDQSSYVANSPITVSWTHLPGKPRDWIAITPAGSSTTTVTTWAYTGGSIDGSAVFTVAATGSYVARAFLDDTYGLVAESAPFTIDAGTISVTTNPVYAVGEQITVTWANTPGNALDWIALAPSSSSDPTVIAWVYTGGAASGSHTFSGLSATGTYVARAFLNDTYTKLAESAVFTVQTSAVLPVTNVAPNLIFEGQGDGGSRPALLVIQGAQFDSSVVVTISGAPNIEVLSTTAGAGGTFLAVQVAAHVDPSLGETDLPLTLTLTKGVQVGTLGGVTLRGLLEFDSGAPQTIQTADLRPLYSRVAYGTNPITFVGVTPAILRAVSSITVGNIDVNGIAPTVPTGVPWGVPGPGGCAGRPPPQIAYNPIPDCGTVWLGGTPGWNQPARGGGGGGFSVPGQHAPDPEGGSGGQSRGSGFVEYYENPARGSNRGGGGGAAGCTGNTPESCQGGAKGGGSGGTVELNAGGNIVAGALGANGAAGGSFSGAGGGGGSGGVIVVRSTGGTISTGAMTATGGPGGAGATSASKGGAGADGRIRYEAPTGATPTTSPSAVRTFGFAITTPTFTTATPTITMTGPSFFTFEIDQTFQDGTTAQNAISQVFSGSVAPTLQPGFNRLCTALGGVHGTPEASTCVDVAYLP